jgi:hypothetical protein
MRSINLMIVSVLLSASVSEAQIDNTQSEVVKVYGNCGMCKTNIEKAGNKKKISKADWNEETKMATITYDSKKTDLDAVLKSIALAGYDSDKYLAPDEAYYKLPACCKYKRDAKPMAKSTGPGPDAMTSMNEHTAHNQVTIANGAQQPDQLKAVFDNYFALKDALVKTDGTMASEKASLLIKALNAVEMGKLKTEEHGIWMKIENDLKGDAQHINENKDPGHQREHFIELSQNMYELIKAAKPPETIYYQFCPMANDGKGANWLSKESAIKNPYYGSQMLTCGKTVETIKQ